MSKYYQNQCFCPHCNTDTIQICRDDQHERDSTQDFRICTICGYQYNGYSGKYNPGDMEDIKFYLNRI